uniref:Uncharacterized protein n=1 Tax=Brassica oleracea var. oleracea TaxID=109376 RepID=A0A0D3B9R8_BRAOL
MTATKMVFHHMVPIFYSFKSFSDLDLNMQVLIRWFSSSTCICFTDLGLIYMFFRSGSDFERLMGSLLGSLLKYNVQEDFQEVFQTTSKKSSRRLSGSLPNDFQEVF